MNYPMCILAMALASAVSPTFAADVPDLSGVWTNSSLTSLTRRDGIDSLVLSPERAAELAGGHFHNVRLAKDQEKSDPNRKAPPKVDRLPGVGNYSANWVDPGSKYAVVNGEIRSSWIVDPADGKLPFTAAARDAMAKRRAASSGIVGPEARALGERCLIGFGGTGGPPMLNVLYNNFYRILQTDDHVMILVEMVHDARVIPIGEDVRSSPDKRFLGRSVGRYEGDELVITTTDFHPARAASGPFLLSGDAVVEERLSRQDADTLFYAFTVTDERFYAQPVRGEMVFTKRDDRIYEYACHEGNYAMPAMLKGARLLEREAAGSGD
jgi:hypothetical protein